MSDKIEIIGGQQYRKEDKHFNPPSLGVISNLINKLLALVGGDLMGKMAHEAYEEGAVECPFTDIEKGFNDYNMAIESVCTLEDIRERVLSCEGLTFTGKWLVDISSKNACQRIGLEHNAMNIRTTLNTAECMQQRKQLALEGLTDWIRKAWDVIMKFLTRIWNWIKGLFGFNNKKPKDKVVDIAAMAQANCDAVLKELAKNEERLKRELEKAIKSSGFADMLEGLDELFTDKSHLSQRVVTKKGEKLATKVKRAKKSATEEISADRVSADSITMVLNEIRGLEPCFSSSKTRYLVTSNVIKKHGGDVRDVVTGTTSMYNAALSFTKFVKNDILPIMEKASKALNKSDLDFESFGDAIAKFPSLKTIASAFGSEATTKGNAVYLSDVPGYADIHFNGVNSIDEIGAAMKTGNMSHVVKTLSFSRGTTISGAEGAYIELVKTQSDLKFCQEQASLLFEAEIELAKLSEAYEKQLGELHKACERASKYEDEVTAKAATSAVRVLMHAMQCYVNAPLATFDHLLTSSIDALCDYTTDSFVCMNPVTAARLIM